MKNIHDSHIIHYIMDDNKVWLGSNATQAGAGSPLSRTWPRCVFVASRRRPDGSEENTIFLHPSSTTNQVLNITKLCGHLILPFQNPLGGPKSCSYL